MPYKRHQHKRNSGKESKRAYNKKGCMYSRKRVAFYGELTADDTRCDAGGISACHVTYAAASLPHAPAEVEDICDVCPLMSSSPDQSWGKAK